MEATVETGLNIEFLKAGVSVIDSPGRNENEALDNLVKEKLENPLAFVIYVVDGHNLFTKQVRNRVGAEGWNFTDTMPMKPTEYEANEKNDRHSDVRKSCLKTSFVFCFLLFFVLLLLLFLG